MELSRLHINNEGELTIKVTVPELDTNSFNIVTGFGTTVVGGSVRIDTILDSFGHAVYTPDLATYVHFYSK